MDIAKTVPVINALKYSSLLLFKTMYVHMNAVVHGVQKRVSDS